MSEDLVYRADSFPPGCICVDCRRPFSDGDRYSQRLAGVGGGVTLVEIICLPCALGVLDEPGG